MFIPYSTDAPLYHWPIVTGSLIVANIAVFCSTNLLAMLGMIDYESIDWLTIQFDTINPLQWMTGQFMHADPIHLLGNMIFLFPFGLIVEGKMGNLRFLAAYLGICLVVGAVTQCCMFALGGEGSALGASAAIAGLMVMALWWAPENELDVFYWFFFIFAGTMEIRVMIFSGFFVLSDVVTLFLTGFTMSGAMGHTLGALCGLGIGIYLLRTGGVDCEGWDIVSRNDWLKEYPLLYGSRQRKLDKSLENEINDPVAEALALTGGDASASSKYGLAARRPKTKTQPRTKTTKQAPSATTSVKTAGRKVPKKKAPKRPRVLEPTAEQIAEKCQSHAEFNRLTYVLRQSLQANNVPAAKQAFQRLDSLQISAGLGDQTLMAYASALGTDKQWIDSIRPLAIVANKKSAMSDDACLRLAQIQLRVLKRPDQAIATLEKIDAHDGIAIDEAKRQRMAKRDELLQSAKAAGQPLT